VERSSVGKPVACLYSAESSR